MRRTFSTSRDLVHHLCETLGLEAERNAVYDAIPVGDWYGRRLTHTEMDALSQDVWNVVTEGAEWPFGNTALDAAELDQRDAD